MKKSDVLTLFDDSIALAAHKMGVAVRTVESWPEVLDRAKVDRVIAALVRGKRLTKAADIARHYPA